MNIQETIALIEALKASGVTRFKSHEHEIDFDQKAVVVPVTKPQSLPASKEDPEVTEKLKNLINTISMSPEELANKMFPDGAL